MKDTHPFFPEMIAGLPYADIPIPGMTAKLLQADGRQVLFMEFREDMSVPEHAHEAQWGAVLDGEMDLTIGGEKRLLKRGDTYYIPKGRPHSMNIRKGYKDVVVYDQHDRYTPKAGS